MQSAKQETRPVKWVAWPFLQVTSPPRQLIHVYAKGSMSSKLSFPPVVFDKGFAERCRLTLAALPATGTHVRMYYCKLWANSQASFLAAKQ